VQVEDDGYFPLAVPAEGGLELIVEGRTQDCESLCEEDAVEGEEQISAATLARAMLTFLERERPCSLLRTMR
jgi:hypothetical protein